MIDIHCHILPGIDDGTRSFDEAVALGEQLIREGVSTVVATPHVFHLRYMTPTSEQILSRLTRLNEAFAGRLRIVCGAEVHVVPEVVSVLHRREILINGGPYMLIEFPSGTVPHGAENLLFELLASGVRPIIAHPERNRVLVGDPQRLCTFVQMGCYAQLTAPYLLANNGARRLALRWIESGLIHFIASDAHRCDWRAPRLAEPYRVLEKECGAAVAHALFVSNPQAVIQGEALPFAPEVRVFNKTKSNWWWGLWGS